VKTLLRLEDLALAGLAVYLFVGLGYAWWLLAILFLVPDVSMVGYLANPRAGAIIYNVVHHRGLAVAVFALGLVIHQPLVAAAGAVLLFHSSVDRALGYGLKHPDSFQHTHLGTIGGKSSE
jgi:hypothetical protein